MRILGIDPGFGRSGYGVIEVQGQKQTALVYGCVETAPHTATGVRLKEIYERMRTIMESYKPDIVAIEQLFFARNVSTAFTASEARGVVVLAAELAGIAQVQYTPLQVKQAVVGYGRAEKSQVQEMVRVLLGLRELPKPDDAADALAVALTHAQQAPFLAAAARIQEQIAKLDQATAVTRRPVQKKRVTP
ncbi:MAG: crossover junction endodeoxyribonuclease RuvC [Firmicutes bacterium]|nr:crossover junction endodeoxyribonuclease RuvC [Bacillota bacterium]